MLVANRISPSPYPPSTPSPTADEALAEHFVDLRGEAEEAAEYKARNRVVGSADPNSAPNPNPNPNPQPELTTTTAAAATTTAATAAASGKGEKERKVAPLTKEEKILLIKQRVRGCWWGPRVPKEIALRLQGKEIGNIEDGPSLSVSLCIPLSLSLSLFLVPYLCLPLYITLNLSIV